MDKGLIWGDQKILTLDKYQQQSFQPVATHFTDCAFPTYVISYAFNDSFQLHMLHRVECSL